jgi:hypothetical protein
LAEILHDLQEQEIDFSGLGKDMDDLAKLLAELIAHLIEQLDINGGVVGCTYFRRQDAAGRRAGEATGRRSCSCQPALSWGRA